MDVFEHRPDVPLIDRVKIQAELLIPLIKSLEVELGTARAHDLVRESLGNVYRNMAARWAAEHGSLGAMGILAEASTGAAAADFIVHDMSATGISFDITGCRYAQFFQQLGEPALGFLLVCTADIPLAEGIPGVSLERAHTIMQGADHCDFRYRYTPEALTEPPGGPHGVHPRSAQTAVTVQPGR